MCAPCLQASERQANFVSRWWCAFLMRSRGVVSMAPGRRCQGLDQARRRNPRTLFSRSICFGMIPRSYPATGGIASTTTPGRGAQTALLDGQPRCHQLCGLRPPWVRVAKWRRGVGRQARQSGGRNLLGLVLMVLATRGNAAHKATAQIVVRQPRDFASVRVPYGKSCL
jgi:hypothetical protein